MAKQERMPFLPPFPFASPNPARCRVGLMVVAGEIFLINSWGLLNIAAPRKLHRKRTLANLGHGDVNAMLYLAFQEPLGLYFYFRNYNT